MDRRAKKRAGVITSHIAKSYCLDCGGLCDAATAFERRPKSGDITVCLYCGHVMAFDRKLRLRELTPQEMYEIAGSPRILAIQRARALFTKDKKP